MGVISLIFLLLFIAVLSRQPLVRWVHPDTDSLTDLPASAPYSSTPFVPSAWEGRHSVLGSLTGSAHMQVGTVTCAGPSGVGPDLQGHSLTPHSSPYSYKSGIPLVIAWRPSPRCGQRFPLVLFCTDLLPCAELHQGL